MKNEALTAQSNYQGIYTLYQTINGRPSWKSGSTAIWHLPGSYNDWAMGPLKYIGEAGRQQIWSINDHGDKNPSDIPSQDWLYYVNWFPKTDGVSVQCLK